MRIQAYAFLLLLSICAGIKACAQVRGKYAPFVVNEETTTATLNLQDTAMAEKFVSVFKKHKMDPTSKDAWSHLFELVARAKEADMAISREFSFDVSDDGIEITAGHLDDLQEVLKSIRLVIATPQKLDAFLTEQEPILNKKKAKQP